MWQCQWQGCLIQAEDGVIGAEGESPFTRLRKVSTVTRSRARGQHESEHHQPIKQEDGRPTQSTTIDREQGRVVRRKVHTGREDAGMDPDVFKRDQGGAQVIAFTRPKVQGQTVDREER
ncbi:BQ5605_C021g09381 [Microbotryum silenes-dioicae]|uniref:BQ5605_C021g09381 protein n=1 Tax=Microbotryum silenes-dioicae TaxID=796604 RepID=A0A2X0PEA9_9BASI|nr:BQ5605_C021g09381 [Microbotryum silenes-dioicae]